MAKKRSDKPTEGTRLLDLWSAPEGAGPAIGCVATTYTFNAEHFEEECLARFVAMETSRDESAKAYLIEREEKFSQVFCCVLADQSHVRATRSLRWHLLPVRIPNAIQHAKLTILLWEKHLRILIGSANLTIPAYRTNYETVSSLDFSTETGAPLSLARECLAFLLGLSEWTPSGFEGIGPRSQLQAFIGRVRQHTSRWPQNDVGRGQPQTVLVPLLPRRQGRPRGVTDQLSSIWQGPLPHSATIVSPFFDQTESALNLVYQSFAPLVTTRGDRSITFRCIGGARPDKKVEAAIPRQLFEHANKHPRMQHYLELVAPTSTEDGVGVRPMHSKAIALKGDGLAVFMSGSSNFTVKGLGLDSRPNAELNLAYVIPAAADKFFNACMASLPPAEEVDEPEKVSFLEVTGDSGAEDATGALLPAGFNEALFEPRGAGGLLRLLMVDADVPKHFRVFTPSGHLILSDDSWAGSHGQEVKCEIDRPISSLSVHWQLPDASWASADWVVNVTELGLLPPPSELAQLNLEDLIVILTSARPIHWLLAERLAARDGGDKKGNVEAIDPHKKVDTSRFLMRRMRRLARALEGLRSRLELPVGSLDGLRWRLQGPFGPLALARAIIAEGEVGAPFFIAEIVSTLRQLQWQSASVISESDRNELMMAVLRELRDLALQEVPGTPDNLRAYVTAELAGIRQ